MYFIGIDIGTSSISGVIYDYEKKEIESVTLENDATILSKDDWEKIQDPDRILQLVLEIVDGFINRYTNIQGIGVTGQMHGILYIDNEGNAVSPLFTWQDRRANQLYKGDKTYSAYLSGITGYPVATGFGLVTHFYNMKNNLIPENSRHICTIMDYTVMKLSGRKNPLTDYSIGASLGFFDLENLVFDKVAFEKIGVDCSLLPQLRESASYCGSFRGIIPVYSAIGDNQAAFLGSVKDIHKSIHITVGTSSQISVYCDKYIRIPTLDTRPFPGGGYILVGAALCGGQAFAMLKNFFMQVLQLFTGEILSESDVYRIMTTVPYKRNEEDMPIVSTLFDGTRFAPWKRGEIESISLTNFTPENLIIGFLKGISRELYDFYYNLPEEIKGNKDTIIGSGNALKKNPLLCRAFEEQFGSNVTFSPYQEEAAFGACLSAVMGEGYPINK